MEKIAVSVSVHEKDLKRFPEVVKACEKAGLKPEATLDAAGVVTGSIDARKIDDLRRVPGVAHVERSRGVKIAPPYSDIQ
jgi:hypothetical protein